jgi:hypothetical protein
VVVHEPGGLHERIADGRAHEAEATALELLGERQPPTSGSPSTKLQRRASRLPSSSCTSRTRLAFSTVEVTLRRFRTMPESWRSASTRRSSKRATAAGSKPAKTLR